MEGSRAKSRGFFIEIMNISNGDKADFNVNNELIIGRISGENLYALPNDLMVSKQHCRLLFRAVICTLKTSARQIIHT